MGAVIELSSAGLLLAALVATTLSPVMMKITQNDEGGYSYNQSSVFFAAELLKLIFSTGWSLKIRATDPVAAGYMKFERSEMVMYSGPAFFFFAQNNLQFIALAHMSSSAFQLLVNCRIILVAVCAGVLLNKYLNPLEWLAIALLTTGSMQYNLSNCSEDGLRVQPVGLAVVFLIACCAAGGNVFSQKVFQGNMQQHVMFRA
jgi:drug/metabolite transporter (DMT)-like permease